MLDVVEEQTPTLALSLLLLLPLLSLSRGTKEAPLTNKKWNKKQKQ